MEQLFISYSWIGPDLYEAVLTSMRGREYAAQGETREIAIDRAYMEARRDRRYAYPKIVYNSEEYWEILKGVMPLSVIPSFSL
jgi:hypothetical protein